MEQFVGTLWHRLVTRAADSGHGAATVRLEAIAKPAGILFRALGGDRGLALKVSQATENAGRRNWLQRLAGSERRIELAWRDREALHFPAAINVFPQAALNRELYFWLAALAAEMRQGEWFVENQQATQRLLEKFPGLNARYQRLLQASLLLRPGPETLAADEAAQERAIRQALAAPGSVARLPPARRPWHPVQLWFHPAPPVAAHAVPAPAVEQEPPEANQAQPASEDQRRRKAQREDMPDGKDAFMMFFRAESIMSWAEYIKINRPTEEDDAEDGKRAADDMDSISVARDGKNTASRLRFDLDLPPEASDDTPLGEGILLPEWHDRKGVLQENHCRLQPMIAVHAAPIALPPHLAATARRIRSQFEALTPARIWLRKQHDGTEIDLDACVQRTIERKSGTAPADVGLYQSYQAQQRDLACLLLADLSQSTDAYVSDQARVIDVIRDSLFLFSEALSATGDRFGLYGFSSLRRDNVRFHVIKEFDDKYDDRTRGRIAAVKPVYYTRMGAAIRHA
ncbi:MAG: nitric oxide reductase, partial [Thiobacillus sp.]|nr:nitric oxide reductase [Thiobacillus sp.]